MHLNSKGTVMKQRIEPSGFTLVELMVVVTIIGLLATIAIPGFVKYLRKSKAVEAHEALQKIKIGAKAYYMSEKWDTHGNFLPNAFPTGINKTPAKPHCDRQLTPTASWDANGWAPVRFALVEAHYFSYDFSSNGSTGIQARYTAYAYGDLDCDGVESTYDIRGAVNNEGDVYTRGPMVTNPTE